MILAGIIFALLVLMVALSFLKRTDGRSYLSFFRSKGEKGQSLRQRLTDWVEKDDPVPDPEELYELLEALHHKGDVTDEEYEQFRREIGEAGGTIDN